MKRFPYLPAGLIAVIAVGLVGCETMFVDPKAEEDGQADYVVTGKTGSFFRAIQIDPRSEDSAGPQFVRAADLNDDGLMDLASVWNQSHPLQVHLQQRDDDGEITFLTVPIAGTTPVARISGLEIVDIDSDGRLDLAVLVKDTGELAVCDVERDDCDVTKDDGIIQGAIWGGLILFFAPEDPVNDIWEPAVLEKTFYAGLDGDKPEEGGYTSLAVGDFDGRLGPDFVTAFNSAEGDPPVNRTDIYLNPGNAKAHDQGSWDNTTIYQDLPTTKAVAVLDVDRDGDDDVITTYPESKGSNIFWLANPLSRDGVEAVANPEHWNVVAPIGRVDTGADWVTLADVDGDDVCDVIMRSSIGQIVQWFQAPELPSTTFIRNPWRVYTLAQFLGREPQAVAVGDLTGDGQVEAVVSAGGTIVWLDSTTAPSVYDQWGENVIVNDPVEESTAANAAALTDPNRDPTAQSAEEQETLVNTLLVVDIDGDGFNDIVGTIDREELSGLSDDSLIWFRNYRTGD